MNIKTANRLLELRKKNNFSQEQLAEKIGVSRQAVSKWERAEASPDIDNLILLSRLYNMSLDELICNDRSEKEEKHLDEIKTTEKETPKENVPIDKVSNGEIEFALEEIAKTVNEINSAQDEIKKVTNKAKKTKTVFRVSNMPLPIIITVIYLILGFAYNWWHPAWVLFLFIPIYYSCFEEVEEDE